MRYDNNRRNLPFFGNIFNMDFIISNIMPLDGVKNDF